MAVDVTDSRHVALYCNSSDHAFGPVFSSPEHAWDFIDWMKQAPLTEYVERFHIKQPEPFFGSWTDPRSWDPNALESLQLIWRDERCDEDGELREAVSAA